MNSLFRIHLMAQLTLLEAIRQKVFHLLILFALVTIGSSVLFSEFSLQEQFKFLKDFSFGAISLFGLLIALMGTASLLPREIENRTIEPILARPVHRAEFLLGKYLGMIGLLAIALFCMAFVFGFIFEIKKQVTLNALTSTPFLSHPNSINLLNQQIEEIHEVTRYTPLFQSLLLIYAKLCLVVALTLLISTLATSSLFTVATALMVYLISHLQSIAREEWTLSGTSLHPITSLFLGSLVYFFPDLQIFSIIDDILAGSLLPWSHLFHVLSISIVYIFVYLGLGILLFYQREF